MEDFIKELDMFPTEKDADIEERITKNNSSGRKETNRAERRIARRNVIKKRKDLAYSIYGYMSETKEVSSHSNCKNYGLKKSWIREKKYRKYSNIEFL